MRRGSCTRGRTSNSHSTSTTRPNRNSSPIKIPYEKRLRFDRIELGTEFVRDISRRFRIHSKTKLDKTRIIQRERKNSWNFNVLPKHSASIFVRLRSKRIVMRTTMIGPNYRWRGRAQDVLVSLSSSLPFGRTRAPSSLSFPRGRKVRLCRVRGRMFLGRCIHAFPFPRPIPTGSPDDTPHPTIPRPASPSPPSPFFSTARAKGN